MVAWRLLNEIESRGKNSSKATSLGGLHEKRQETLSQFFTPEWIVQFLWGVIGKSFSSGVRYRLLDNSIGAASMFRFAKPCQHTLHGIDVDGEVVGRVAAALDDAGFRLDVQQAGMESVELGQYSAALINPPFSINLSSPSLTEYEGVTHYGKHGPNTSALSHEYALAQALAHADIVAAVTPRTATLRLEAGRFGVEAKSRLRAVLALPGDCFKVENVESVRVDLLIFGRAVKESFPVVRQQIYGDTPPIQLDGLSCRSEMDLKTEKISVVGIDDAGPVVTTPVTGDNTVRLRQSGRKVKLVFSDGATEAKVLNAVYQARLYSTYLHRYPVTTRYEGQLALDLDVLVMQDSPEDALIELAERIRKAGGEPVIEKQLWRGLSAMIEEHRRMSVPYGRWAYRKGTPSFAATSRLLTMIDVRQPKSAVEAGDVVTAVRTETGFNVHTKRGCFACDHDSFLSVFDIEDAAAGEGYWEEVAPPIRNSYPLEIAKMEEKARSLGLDEWLTWDFQREDLYELAFRPRGGVCGWQMALGKTRLAFALGMLLEGKTLIVVKSRLVDEMCRELDALGLGVDDYTLIESAKDTRNLKKINIVSYDRLKRPIDSRCSGKYTISKMLKGRIDNLICDEGGLLSNVHSQQTQSVTRIGGKRKYVFDGTPMANYPREMMPLACWAVGDARSYQPYSVKGGHLDASLFQSALHQRTGRQAFNDDFVCLEWATNEFLVDGKGAKREIPKIKSGGIGAFRSWIAPQIKRRVQQEPDVAKHVTFPVPVLHAPELVGWDLEHLKLYVKTTEEFAEWFKNYQEERQDGGQSLNLTVILAKLEACFKAANNPHMVSGFAKPYLPMTSKQKRCIALVVDEVRKGRRPIVFARSPSVLTRLSKALTAAGVTSMVFSGQESIVKRTKRLNAEIRKGDTQVMLASLGVTQDGLNLPELNTFIFYNRSYKSREEFQAIYRLIRPTQKMDVYGRFLHLEGSIDEYMGQLIEWKALASESGLDYGEGVSDSKDFVHFDTFLARFLESIPFLKEKLEALKAS